MTPIMSLRSYAGDFDCSVCRQKRLTAASFSKSMANKKRANPGAPLKCLECVEKAAVAERNAAQERSENAGAAAVEEEAVVKCKGCEKDLPMSSFSASQRRKTDGARCIPCVSDTEKRERQKVLESKAQSLETAQKSYEQLGANASAAERLLAAAAETAEEAKFVTGLKPVKLGRRGRGGSWRNRGRGRGSSSAAHP